MFSFSSVVCLQNLLFDQKLGGALADQRPATGGLKKLGHTDHEPQYITYDVLCGLGSIVE